MSQEERISQHRKMIEQFRNDIAWLKEHEFHFRPSPDGSPGESTEDLVAREERNIEMYEGFIAQLKEQIDNA